MPIFSHHCVVLPLTKPGKLATIFDQIPTPKPQLTSGQTQWIRCFARPQVRTVAQCLLRKDEGREK